MANTKILRADEQHIGPYDQPMVEALDIGDVREGALELSVSEVTAGTLTIGLHTAVRNRHQDYFKLTEVAFAAAGTTLLYFSSGLGTYLRTRAQLGAADGATWEALWASKR